jgi:hypothetical protein
MGERKGRLEEGHERGRKGGSVLLQWGALARPQLNVWRRHADR